MSIQRYYVWEDQLWLPEQKASDAANYMETVVKYADHVAAVAEARQAGRLLASKHESDVIAAERARIRQAVEAMPRTGGWTTPDGVIHEVDVDAVLAIIDGEGTA